MVMEQKQSASRFDWTLAFILLLFFIISCLAIASAQITSPYHTNFVLRQVVWYVVGFGIICSAMLFDPDQYKRLSWILYIFGVLSLALLHVAPDSIAETRNGAKSWFTFEHIGSIQPSEFMKTFLILAVSRLIMKHHERYPEKTWQTDIILLVKIGVTVLIPLGFIMMQPDLGTSMVIVAITSGLLLVSGITWKILLPLFMTASLFVGCVIFIALYAPHLLEKYLDSYQIARIYSWLNPYDYQQLEGFNLVRSLTAIGSGEIVGKGFKEREVYVPENHTDFIFSVIGEEYGFIGGSLVICLYFFLIYHMTRIALDTNDPFNSYVCAGIICMTTFHVFQNIGMTIQVLPITGIPLPFISYGGSSLMGNMLAMGIIFSIRYYHHSYLFASEENRVLSI
jgi:rod shape determining protein RodA